MAAQKFKKGDKVIFKKIGDLKTNKNVFTVMETHENTAHKNPYAILNDKEKSMHVAESCLDFA